MLAFAYRVGGRPCMMEVTPAGWILLMRKRARKGVLVAAFSRWQHRANDGARVRAAGPPRPSPSTATFGLEVEVA